jgi:hypothetical protein
MLSIPTAPTNIFWFLWWLEQRERVLAHRGPPSPRNQQTNDYSRISSANRFRSFIPIAPIRVRID